MAPQLFVSLLLSLVLVVYAGIAITTRFRLRGVHVVRCPDTRTMAAVTVNLGHATATALWEKADVRLATCSCWPERKACAEGCAAQIAAAPELTRVAKERARQ